MAVNAAKILACFLDRASSDEDERMESDDDEAEDDEVIPDPIPGRDWSTFNPKLGKDKKFMNTCTSSIVFVR
jgi:hypothetical protein